MFEGLQNLLDACLRLRIERFIHVSSVAVYGDPPPPESAHEDAPTMPAKGSYGWDKLRQDRMVQAACRRGLPSVLVCPPYMTGRYSNFLLRLVRMIAEGRFALVDDGAAPCNVVDVHNLAQAMDLALSCGPGDGSRVFVTHDEAISWRDLVEAVAPLAESAIPPAMSRADAQRLAAAGGPGRPSTLRTARRLLGSAQVREALRDDALVQGAYRLVARAATVLPAGLRTRLERLTRPARRFSPPPSRPAWDRQLCTIQLRGVRHAGDKARTVLGYRPELSFAESMRTFRAWYAGTRGWGADWAPLLRALEASAPAFAE
jgi:nucleoside-diphosphate-sugar epimerase